MKSVCLAVVVGWLLTSMCNAQSSIGLYGSIDEGVSYTSNAQGSRSAFVGPVAVPDFFGIRGREELGGGVTAIVALQQAFKSNSGTQTIPGNAFSHFAYVALSNKAYGTLTLGRQLDFAAEALRVDSNGTNHLGFYFFHPANLDNLGIIGDSINNSIKYTSPRFQGLIGSVLYGFSDGSTQPGRVIGAAVVFDQDGPVHASFIFSSWRNHSIPLVSGLGTSTFLGESLAQGAVFAAAKQDIFGLSARYKVGTQVDLHGVLSQVNLASMTISGRMRNAEIGANFHVTHDSTITIGGYLSWLTEKRYVQANVGDLYALSKRTTIYAQAAFQHADGASHAAIPLLAPSNSSNQLVLRVGVHHFF